MSDDCTKARTDFYFLDRLGTATTMHLLQAAAEVAPDLPTRVDAVYAVKEPSEAAGLLRVVAAGHPSGEVAVVCPPEVIAAAARAARRCGGRRVVLPARVSSTVVRVDAGRDDFWQELSDLQAEAAATAAWAAAALLAEV